MRTGLLAVVLLAPVMAQTPAAEFTAASVRPNTSGDNTTGFQIFPGGQFRATNATVRQIVQAAYDFQFERFQIVGGPSWIDVDRYDVQATPATEATADRPATAQDIALRVQALLRVRFALVMRRETRDMDRFELVVGRGGHRLRAKTGDCDPRCGLSYLPDSGDVQHLVAKGVPIRDLARRLQGVVGAVIVDKTGLGATYDFTLDYVRPRSAGSPDTADGVTLFTALPEQLGLRLERTRGPVDVVVIDSVARPNAD